MSNEEEINATLDIINKNVLIIHEDIINLYLTVTQLQKIIVKNQTNLSMLTKYVLRKVK